MASHQPHRTEGDTMRRIASEVHAVSLLADEKLSKFFDSINLISKPYIYTIKHRVKPAYDIVRKVERKRINQEIGSNNWHYEPHHITDGCGFRIVTVFQSDIISVANELISIINHDSQQSPFLRHRLKEVIFYTNRPKEEENSVHVEVVKLFNSAKYVSDDNGYSITIASPENKKSGYSSLHLVAFVPINHVNWEGREITTNVAVEIQIRDMFEEAWGEVDHALRYILEREDRGDESNPLVAAWLPHLNALKTFADGCSQHASLIKRNAIDAAAVTAGEERLSLDSANQAISEVQHIAPSRYHAQIHQAFELRDYFSKTAANPIEKLDASRRAVESFSVLMSDLNDLLDNALQSGRSLRFRLEMELAYCLSYEDPESLNRAIAIYEKQLKSYPFDVIVNYRLGRALREKGSLEKAIEYFSDAGKSFGKDNTVHADDWVHSAVVRNLGYTHWALAEEYVKKGDNAKAKENLISSIVLSKESADRSNHVKNSINEKRKSLNNKVWFMCRYIEIFGEDKLCDKTTLNECISKLESSINESRFIDVYALDTLSFAYKLVGDVDRHKETISSMASAIYELAQKNSKGEHFDILAIKTYLPSDLHDIVDEIANQIFSSKSGD